MNGVSELVAGKRVALLVNRSALGASCAANYVSAATFVPVGVEGSLPPVVRGLIAMLWPLALMGGELLLTRVPAVGSRLLVWSCRLAALVVAVFAFAGSAEHLVSLARRAGASPLAAWSAPIIIDGLLLISGLVLVGLADAINTAKKADAARKAAMEQASNTAQKSTAEAGRSSRADRSGRLAAVKQPSVATSNGRNSNRLSAGDVEAALAADPSVTAGVLAERFGVSARTVRRSSAWQQRESVVAS